MIRFYTDDRSLDEAYAVEQNDVVILPRGYHPVCAAGDETLTSPAPLFSFITPSKVVLLNHWRLEIGRIE